MMDLRAIILFVPFVLYSGTVMAGSGAHPAPAAAMNADQALQALIEGNKRYSSARMKHPDQTVHRLKSVAKEQHPFAVVVGCSDSRVPPEIVFDQGLGDLFVIREAGHVVDDVTLASAEYAVSHLATPLIVVLGHERCGAIQAAIQGESGGHVPALVNSIKPAFNGIPKDAKNYAERVTRRHIELSVQNFLSDQPILTDAIKAGKLKVLGAYYDLDTGRVQFLDGKKTEPAVRSKAPKVKKGT